jgi:hypothetical protein
MVAERVREQIMTKVVALVEGIFAWWMTGEKDKPFYTLEHKGAETGREFARGLVQALVDGSGTGLCGARQVDGHGVERVFKGYAEKTYQTLLGPVTVRSAVYYRKGAGPETVYPARERFGLGEGDYSQGLEEAVVLAGVDDVYRKGLKLVNRLTGAQVSVHKAETTVASWGAKAKARVAADLKRPKTPQERIAATRPVPGTRMCVTTDGTSIRTTAGWRDAKLLGIYTFDEKGKKKDLVAYAATLHYAENYGDLAWWLMERTGASRAETLVWLGDGAPWIRNQQQFLAPHAVSIVDFYHAADRLWKVGRALHPRAEREAKRWSQKWIRNLYTGKVQALIKELQTRAAPLGLPPSQCAEDDPRKVLADAPRYFVNNADRMAYSKYRVLGYPIGSGVAESACHHLVGVRMKRTASMEWAEENAEAVLQLRCLSASEYWDEFWGLDKLWQIIHARAA